ncbi:MAG: hypothetical protein HYZ34_11630 [Ignavibacteriae bacterium]|nr:hypothetical protein [Ignavibacteriota bacterium]
MDFYMGSIWVGRRANLTPFYEAIFQILKELKCDWIYSFPRMYLTDFGSKKDEDVNPALYNPNEAILKETEHNERQKEVEDFRRQLDDVYEESIKNAQHKLLPEEVEAYKRTYGRLPQGWPH